LPNHPKIIDQTQPMFALLRNEVRYLPNDGEG
jgi:hypothetical protein